MLLDTYSRLILPQLYCNPQVVGVRWFAALRAVFSICGTSVEFLLFCMIWNCRIQSPAVSKQRDIRWCGFRNSIPISIDYLWNACIDLAISSPSYSYCIWNRYWQNHRSILPNFPLCPWFDTLEFRRLPWSNNKMYDDAVFADRFRYHLTIFGMCILIRLSRLLKIHTAYEIAI